ncbi:uncharacterized protein LOC100893802 [Strongylocentrotus purpuratus]|uniref:Uncharacterized protein n=1 Tax=Strongylocentrotus purpuratus TaxID=7668 RepID=A0A7M7T068_STRPU|nr:uncharacterized protein LOC100893802 [Strongylocentrotus purpuratus]
MIPLKVHDEMLQRSTDRALLAERKVSVLEQEVKMLSAQRSEPQIFTLPVMPPISESPSDDYEEPHREPHHSLGEETSKPPRVPSRSQGLGVMPSVITSSTRDRTKKVNDHTNDLNRHGTTGKHTLVLANGHANIHDRQQPSPRTLPVSTYPRGISVMPSVVPQPVMPSIATVRSTTKNGHFEGYPEPHVTNGSKTHGRSSKQSAKAFRKNNGTVHYISASSKIERLVAQPKARRRPSVHSLVTQSIMNLDDQREREHLEEEERKCLQAEREEMERLERERVEILNKENKASTYKGRFRKTTKASKGGRSFLSRINTSKPKAAKSGTQKSLLSRMHTKFFTTRRKTLRHIYDLPEVSSLESCSLTSDYETPSQRMQDFAATPMIFGHDQDSEESDWSSSEEATTSRSNKQRRSAGKPRDRHRPKTNKPTPPPIAPKPKKKYNTSPSGSSNPPSSPDTTSPDTTPEISFDDIVIETPQLKPYKRIHGPQGRRKPQRFSNQSESRQSELTLESDLSR